jgi:hypothetical protein
MSAAMGPATHTANFTFLDPSKFLSLPDGPVDEGTGLPTIILPAGAELYRADHGGAKEPGANVPAFFTNRGSTRVYTHGAKGTLSQYVVKKPARLFHMSLDSLDKRMIGSYADKLTDEDLEVFMNYIEHDDLGFTQYVNPSGFTATDLDEYKSGKVTHPNYLNRRMAEIVCRLGFDGWIVKPYTVDERTGAGTGLIQFSMGLMLKQRAELEEKLSVAKSGEEKKALIMDFEQNPPLTAYKPEIMLCRWKEHMDLKSLAVPNNVAGGVSAGKARRSRTRKAQRKMRRSK